MINVNTKKNKTVNINYINESATHTQNCNKKKRNCTKYENENLVRKMLIVNMKYYYQINT